LDPPYGLLCAISRTSLSKLTVEWLQWRSDA